MAEPEDPKAQDPSPNQQPTPEQIQEMQEQQRRAQAQGGGRGRQQGRPQAPDQSQLEQEATAPENRRWELRAREKINKIFFGGVGSAVTASTMGATSLLIPASFTAGGIVGKTIKGDKSFGKILDEALSQYAAVNTILYPMVALGDAVFPLINNTDLAGKLARSAVAMGPYNASFVTSYSAANYMYDNQGDPTGLGKHLKEHVGPMTKQFALVFAPGYSLAANGVSTIAGYPTFMYNALPAAATATAWPFKTKEEKKQAKIHKLNTPTDTKIDNAIKTSGGDAYNSSAGQYSKTA